MILKTDVRKFLQLSKYSKAISLILYMVYLQSIHVIRKGSVLLDFLVCLMWQDMKRKIMCAYKLGAQYAKTTKK